MIGNILQGRDQQYVASKDDKNTWRILDTWHDALKSAQVEDEISDDSPAVTVITEGGFIALIKEAARSGILENATFGSDGIASEEHESALFDKDQEIQQLNQKIVQLEDERTTSKKPTFRTDDYELKGKAMDSILKLVSLQDMANLGYKES